MTGDRDILLDRIERLERRHARVMRTLSLGAATLGAIGIAWLAGVDVGVPASAQSRAGAPSEIVASSIKLVDANGKPRAALYVQGQSAGFAVSDPAGQTRVLLSVDEESAKLAIVGAREGFPRIVLAQSGDVQMLNLEDQTSAIGLTHSGGAPSILVSSGRTSATLGITESFARGQQTRTLAPSLELQQDGRTIATIPAAPSR
jgi:hypothetical protein